jgi:hypothetical protein
LIVTAIWFVEVLVSRSGLVLDTGLAQKLTFFGKAYMMTGWPLANIQSDMMILTRLFSSSPTTLSTLPIPNIVLTLSKGFKAGLVDADRLLAPSVTSVVVMSQYEETPL